MHRRLLILLTAIAAAFAEVSCETDVREGIINQDKYIDTYIQNNFADFEVVRDRGICRVVLVDTLAGVPSIEKGDSTYLFLIGYTFGQNGPVSQFVRDSGMFRVGSGDLIPGLDRGLVGAHLGQEALVVFSSENGYGNQQVGLVPENTALLFEVLVAAIKKN